MIAINTTGITKYKPSVIYKKLKNHYLTPSTRSFLQKSLI